MGPSDFWAEIGAGPLEKGRREGGLEKHEQIMKHAKKKGCFLMARNHVWRHTLRLFHTFARLKKRRQIKEKQISQFLFLGQKTTLGRPRVALFDNLA